VSRLLWSLFPPASHLRSLLDLEGHSTESRPHEATECVARFFTLSSVSFTLRTLSARDRSFKSANNSFFRFVLSAHFSALFTNLLKVSFCIPPFPFPIDYLPHLVFFRLRRLPLWRVVGESGSEGSTSPPLFQHLMGATFLHFELTCYTMEASCSLTPSWIFYGVSQSRYSGEPFLFSLFLQEAPLFFFFLSVPS